MSYLLHLLLVLLFGLHHRKEVIQPQVLLRLPCYDFTPITSYTVGIYLLLLSWPNDI